MSKTLAEWMLDPTTRGGDAFTPSDGIDPRRAIINGHRCLVMLNSGEEQDEFDENNVDHVPLRDFRLQWNRLPMDLKDLTAQEALDRGLVVMADWAPPVQGKQIDPCMAIVNNRRCGVIRPCPKHHP